MLVVDSDGEDLTSRADPFGGTPTASRGVPVRHEIPVWLPVTTSTVKVFAPSGATVTVWGYTR